MEEEAKQKYLAIKELFNRTSNEICVVIESYYIWRTLTFSRSTSENSQEEADRNVQTISLYKEFFLPTEQSHLNTFTIGLMKFFDPHPKALSLSRLMKEIELNKELFTPKIVRSLHPNLAHTDAIKDDYVPITQGVIDEVEKLRQPHEKLIANLKDVRDKQLAHMDVIAFKGNFVPNEVEGLIKAIQEMFNKLSGVFDLSSTIWDHLGEDSVRSVKFLLENLERGEKQRLVERKELHGY